LHLKHLSWPGRSYELCGEEIAAIGLVVFLLPLPLLAGAVGCGCIACATTYILILDELNPFITKHKCNKHSSKTGSTS
jgi:hypothetical protein